MADRTSHVTEAPVTRELVLTRLCAAPRDVVFKAWTTPKRLKRWWGPAGVTNPVCEINVRPGGAIRLHMQAPDGTVYPMTGAYREIAEPERLVFTSSAPEGVDCQNKSVFVEVVRPQRIALDHVSGPQFRAEATFTEQAGRTRLTFRMVFPSATECEKVKGFAAQANEEHLDRLEAQLAKGPTS